MNELQIFKSPEFGQVRTIVKNDEVWFIGKDVAETLGYSNPPKAIRDHVDEDDKLTERIVLSGQNREVIIINESGLYSLVLSSKLPSAKKFKRWITKEVIPSIRKYGGYIAKPLNQLDILEKSIQIMKEQQKRLEEHDNRLAKVENNIQQIKELEQMNASNFRLHFGAITRKIAHYYPCLDMENPYQAIRHEFYERLEAEARCDLDRRLKNKKERALRAGFSKNKIKEINKLDIIQEDTRLINSAIAVLKKMSIQYGIN
nr:MAG: hypothetical protein [Bacteriophage sp.]